LDESGEIGGGANCWPSAATGSGQRDGAGATGGGAGAGGEGGRENN